MNGISDVDMNGISDVRSLNEYIEHFNEQYYPESNLKPIIGGGKSDCPEVMMVFINPTKRNIASDPSWTGLRVPWIGITPIWKVFNESGLVSDHMLDEILRIKKSWTPEFTQQIYGALEESGIYITNIVKWAGEDATLPEKEKIKRYLPILEKEIELVRPKHIVAFGAIPYNNLTGDKKSFKEIYRDFEIITKLPLKGIMVNTFKTKIVPCYFPVGMGRFNRPQAIKILQTLQDQLHLQIATIKQQVLL
jgi:uracil-DNA glycosylase family 4